MMNSKLCLGTVQFGISYGVNNSAGIPTALGYPVNSFMLQNNRPLFVGGGKRERKNGTSNEDEFNMD